MANANTCTIGLRIYNKINRPASTDSERLRNASVGDVSDVMRGVGVVDSGISAVYQPMKRIFGPAITVDLSPGDGLVLRAAIDVAKPGDVIVANAHGVTARAILGGAIGMHMVHRGVVGLIVDGAVRDIAEFRALGLPVMARAVTPRSGTSPAGWGEVNAPIACGGAVVHPGDVVIGDEEGLVVVPRAWVSSVADGLGDTGHPTFSPETLQQRLKAMAPSIPILGIDRVHKAIAERNGIVIDAAYGDPDVR